MGKDLWGANSETGSIAGFFVKNLEEEMKKYYLLVLMLFLVSLLHPNQVFAIQGEPNNPLPGTDHENVGPNPVDFGSIIPVVRETGLISLSIDGLGTNNVGGSIIQVDKPVGATVRSAYMGAASTGFGGRVLVDGDVTIDGNPVTWDLSTPSSIGSSNHWANVTELVKPKIDGAVPGRVDFTITEVETFGIDGEILVVIFDDPNQTVQNTVMLLFGAQYVLGDTFNIGLAEPANINDPDFAIYMSLGISFGYQPSGQFSLVDVNGVLLTSAAGGQDDGEPDNGALLTVGGIDDSNNNPMDPFAEPTNFNEPDDELYDLLPFISNGDTGVQVNTINPSNDDNIFFAAFFVKSAVATVGGGEQGANLVLSKQAPPSKDRGNLIEYRLHYHNLGDGTAQNIVLDDLLSDAVEFVSASDNGNYDADTRTISWNVGDLAPFDHGEVNVTVRIPASATTGTLIQNHAQIATSDHEVRYDDNEANTQTMVTGSDLPVGISVEPNNGGPTLSVYWGTPVTFSYTAPPSVIGVDIKIHVDDGGPDIIDSMAGGPPEWTYTTTFHPRHGDTTVTYTIHEPTPYGVDFDVRSMRGFENTVTADEIVNYIRDRMPGSPMLDEADIGQRFVSAGTQNHVNPAFLVATAEHESQFGTQGWAATHPEAHNAMGYGVPSGSTPPNDINSADSWGDMVERVARSIGNPNGLYYGSGLYTVNQIRTKYAGFPASQAIANYMNELADFGGQAGDYDENFNIYIDPAGYIYDIQTGDRVEGAIVWLQWPDENGNWENVPTGQDPPVAQPDVNPLITGTDGQYQWDVLAGSYRVHVEAPGYYPADSPIVSIPPPVTDLHVGLIPKQVTNAQPVLTVPAQLKVHYSTPLSFGISATDPDDSGDTLTFSTTGLPNNLTITNNGDGTATVSGIVNVAPGIYTAEITVTDPGGLSDTKPVTIEVVYSVPTLPILDNFNRANGAIGTNWLGNKTRYLISNNQLFLNYYSTKTDIFWKSTFGADQEAYVTFSKIGATSKEQSLLLKSQSNRTWGNGVLEVQYSPRDKAIQVWTWQWPGGWVKYGDDIPVTFVNGDVFGARARADGIVEIYQNGELLGTRDITAWPHYAKNGYIGLWVSDAKATLLDDFGGGTVPAFP